MSFVDFAPIFDALEALASFAMLVAVTSPPLLISSLTQIKSKTIEIELRRPACIFEGGNVAISRRIAERWRLIGAGIVG